MYFLKYYKNYYIIYLYIIMNINNYNITIIKIKKIIYYLQYKIHMKFFFKILFNKNFFIFIKILLLLKIQLIL